MKKYIRLSIGMIMCILLSACGSSAKADPIVLPATEDIISISVLMFPVQYSAMPIIAWHWLYISV